MPQKQKNLIDINCLIIMLVKMKLLVLIFLALTQYGFSCKYEIIFQILIYWLRIAFSNTYSDNC